MHTNNGAGDVGFGIVVELFAVVGAFVGGDGAALVFPLRNLRLRRPRQRLLLLQPLVDAFLLLRGFRDLVPDDQISSWLPRPRYGYQYNTMP